MVETVKTIHELSLQAPMSNIGIGAFFWNLFKNSVASFRKVLTLVGNFLNQHLS